MENKKKIILIAPSILPIPAVESGAYEQLIELLININELYYDVDFIVISLANRKTKEHRLKYKRTEFIDFNNNIFLRLSNKINKIISKNRIDKPWYNFHLTQIMNIVLKNKFDKLIIFGNVNQIRPLASVVQKGKIIFYLATEILSNVSDFSLCSKIVLGNKRMIKLIRSNASELDQTPLMNLVPGIDIDYYKTCNHEKVNSLRNKFNIDDKTTVICYTGRIVNSKGVSLFLNSCLQLNHLNNFKILLIGSLGSSFGNKSISSNQTDIDGIKELIGKLGPKCISTGFVESEDLPDYLALTDIGVVPSLCEDVAPGSYLQFLCLGKPTVVSNAGGIPEFFSDEYSLMFERGDNMENDFACHLEYLIKNPDVREKMGKEALKMRTILSKERYYTDFIDIVLN